MAYERFCLYCFEDNGGQNICPHCGRDARAAVPQIQLLPGTRVYHKRFLIGRALGQDASGIVYAAYDTKREAKLRIREYVPREFAQRTPDGTIVPLAGMESRFEKGMEKLRSSVESVEEPSKRHFYFEENGTAYIAQRKAAAAAAGKAAARKGKSSGGSVILILGLIIAIILAAAAIIWIFNGGLEPSSDTTLTPTVSPTALWQPTQTATPIPTAPPTFEPTRAADGNTTVGDVTNEPTNTQGTLTWLDAMGQESGSASVSMPTMAPNAQTSFPSSGSNTGSTSAPANNAPLDAGTSTEKYTTVSKNSSSATIRKLQQRLFDLGWLQDGVDGKYGSSTKQAIKEFQSYINETFNLAEPLDVDGKAGKLTQAWLYERDIYRPSSTPATQAPTTAPVDEKIIQEGSPMDSVYDVQEMLFALGLLEDASVDGEYNVETRQAVLLFQQTVNRYQGFNILPETGTVDELTYLYLTSYYEGWGGSSGGNKPSSTRRPSTTNKPSATQAPAETDTPDAPETGDVVTPDSDKVSIKYMQQMLIKVGLLKKGDDDGKYGNATTDALIKFQQWMNEALNGSDTLSVTGQADSKTLAYLESASDYGMKYGDPMQTPAPVETEIPDAPETGDNVDGDSEKESIKYVQQMLIKVGYLRPNSDDGSYGDNTSTAVQRFQKRVNELEGEGTLTVNGKCDSRTLAYLEYYASLGSVIAPSAEATLDPGTGGTEPGEGGDVGGGTEPGEGGNLGGTEPGEGDGNPGNLSEGGNPDSGDLGDGNTEGGNTEGGNTEGGNPDGGDLGDGGNTEGGESGNTGDNEDIYDTTKPTPSPSPSPYPTITPLPGTSGNPFNPGTIASTARGASDNSHYGASAEAYVPVSRLVVDLNGVTNGSTVEATNGEVNCSWTADGSIASYSFYMTDSLGRTVTSTENTDKDGIHFKTDGLTPGETYTITVSGTPAEGGDPVWATASFIVPGEGEQTNDVDLSAMEAEDSASAESGVAEISSPEIVMDGTAHNKNGVPILSGSTLILSWSANGDVDHYNIYMIDGDGNESKVMETNDTSRTFSREKIPTGTYEIYIGAVPVGATSDDDVKWSSVSFIVDEEA